MTEGEKLFNETFGRWMYAWSTVSNFREMFTSVSDMVAEKTHSRLELLMRDVVHQPGWKGYLHDPDGLEQLLESGLVSNASKKFAASGYGSIDAATIVFYQSILDAIAFDYCRVTALHAPQDWEKDVQATQITILDARTQTYDQILRTKIDQNLEKLEMSSLPEKIRRLFSKCNPAPAPDPESYQFDVDKITAFDKQRREIVHGGAFGKPLTIFPTTPQNIEFLVQTGLHLMLVVRQKYGLHLDLGFVGDALASS